MFCNICVTECTAKPVHPSLIPFFPVFLFVFICSLRKHWGTIVEPSTFRFQHICRKRRLSKSSLLLNHFWESAGRYFLPVSVIVCARSQECKRKNGNIFHFIRCPRKHQRPALARKRRSYDVTDTDSTLMDMNQPKNARLSFRTKRFRARLVPIE